MPETDESCCRRRLDAETFEKRVFALIARGYTEERARSIADSEQETAVARRYGKEAIA